MTTPAANLALAVSAIDNAVGYLNAAALDAGNPDVTDELKTIAVYLRHQAASVHALRSALEPDLTEALERALGASAGENCS